MSGLIAVEQWFEHHVAPDIAKVKDDIEKVLTFAKDHAANASELASLVEKLVQAADPAAAPVVAALVADAGRIAAEAERIAAEVIG